MQLPSDPPAAVFVIGGKEYAAPPMRFLQLKRAWPHIQALAAASDVVDTASATLAIINAALLLTKGAPSLAQLEAELTFQEINGLAQPLRALLDATGLVASGEAEAAGSTAISTG